MKTTLTSLVALALAVSPMAALAHETGELHPHPLGVTASTSVRAQAQVEFEAKREAARAEIQVKLDAQRNKTIANAKERATKEIDRRIEHLNKLSDRIENMVRISDSAEASLQTMISGQISALTTLEGQIMGTDATSSLRMYIESITKTYRIYALVMPQIAILAAADRALGTGAQLEQVAVKLDARLDTAAAAGANVSSLEGKLNDMRAKITSAAQKANDAISAVGGLTPDNGDQAKAEANRAALKAAHEKVRGAQSDLHEARKIGGEIVRGLKTMSGSGTGTTTVQ